jgi:hypothetical protein
MQKMLNSLAALAVINLDIKKLVLISEILVIYDATFGDNFINITQKIISRVKVHTWEI